MDYAIQRKGLKAPNEEESLIRKVWGFIIDPFDINGNYNRIYSQTENVLNKAEKVISDIAMLSQIAPIIPEETIDYLKNTSILSSIINNTENLVWFSDLSGNIMLVNNNAKKYFLPKGIDFSSINKKDLFEYYEKFMDKETVLFMKKILDTDDRVLSNETPLSFVVKGKKSKKEETIKLNKNLVLDKENNIKGILGIGRIITKETMILNELLAMDFCGNENVVKEKLTTLLTHIEEPTTFNK